ncbi:eukaryotic peptide chain release factor GTP-binding subunit ERF3A-like [Amborella trichopoda]|uniref:eukaryotic peptide chain release factor GTP-binding subunit ERF3A-like n=1 Tax=Amborella trichopoda TaxID=13333 RepID=UPI0005D42146|nr:eukaryotic peptide chain release factor GTP-binding subunit ERF3A-like [Amborella trichopoda]|eukprot:XP_011627162.1 eukaryotic peptide chain release factor GTP-binding subunit ERF3A-like [Amborella trichopoda]
MKLGRIPVIDKLKDLGIALMGKIKYGSVREGDNLLVMSNRAGVKVLAVYCDENKVQCAGPDENVRVRLSGIEEEDISVGFVLSSMEKPIAAVVEFDAHLQILELLDNAIFTAGYKAVLHIHSIVEECEISDFYNQIDLKTRRPMNGKVLFLKNGVIVAHRIPVYSIERLSNFLLICVKKFSDIPQLGRFTLRSEGKTVAVGKVTGV